MLLIATHLVVFFLFSIGLKASTIEDEFFDVEDPKNPPEFDVKRAEFLKVPTKYEDVNTNEVLLPSFEPVVPEKPPRLDLIGG